MKQFILNSEPDKDNIIRLDGNDYHYLVRVRRLTAGKFFPAVLPKGGQTLIQALSIEHGVITGKCHAPQETIQETASLGTHSACCSMPSIVLFQALTKGDKMDLIVRQAVEGGITEIVPFVSEFSLAKTNAAGQKFLRWERIIKEAKQQSGSKIATSIRQPLSLNDLLDYWKKIKNNALGLLFHHQGLEQKSLHSYLSNIPQTIALTIGPEGGFSSKEVSIFLENGLLPFTIGDTILRTETAALYCAAAIKILLLERDSWELKQLKANSG